MSQTVKFEDEDGVKYKDQDGELLTLLKTPEKLPDCEEPKTCLPELHQDLKVARKPCHLEKLSARSRTEEKSLPVKNYSPILRFSAVMDGRHNNINNKDHMNDFATSCFVGKDNYLQIPDLSKSESCRELVSVSKTSVTYRFFKGKAKKKIGILDKLDQLQPDFIKSLTRRKGKGPAYNKLHAFVKFLTTLNRNNRLKPKQIGVEAVANAKGFEFEVGSIEKFASLLGKFLPKEISLIRNPSYDDDDNNTFAGRCEDVGTLRQSERSPTSDKVMASDAGTGATEPVQMLSELVKPCKRARVLLKKLEKTEVQKFIKSSSGTDTEGKRRCEECSITFLTPESLYVHSLTRHLRARRNVTEASTAKTLLPGFACQQCDLTFKKQSEVKTHLKTVHGVAALFACLVCNLTFSASITMKLHLQKVHESYECQVCSKTFEDKRMLQKHSISSHGKSISEFDCKFCRKKFNKIGFLQRHLSTYHTTNQNTQEKENRGNEINNDQKIDNIKDLGKGRGKYRSKASATLPSKEERKKGEVKKRTVILRQDSNVTEIVFNSKESLVETLMASRCATSLQKIKTKPELTRYQAEAHKPRESLPIHAGSLERLKVEKIPNVEPLQVSTVPAVEAAKVSAVSLKVRDMPDMQFFKCKTCSKFFVNETSYEQHVKSAHDPAASEQTSIKIANVISLAPTTLEDDVHIDVKPHLSSLPVFDSFEATDKTPARKSSLHSPDIVSTTKAETPVNTRRESRLRQKRQNEPEESPTTAKRKYYVSTKVKEGFQCEICSRVFNHKGFYQKHLRLTHKVTENNQTLSSKSEPTTRPQAGEGKKFTPKQSPARRRRTQNRTEQRKSSQPDQEQQLVTKIKTEPGTETASKTSENVAIKCITCNKSFVSNIELVRHMQVDHAPDQQRGKKKADSFVINCGFCFRTFESQEDVMKHIDQEHNKKSGTDKRKRQPIVTEKSMLICVVCEQIFSSQVTLDMHMRSEHAGRPDRKNFLQKTSANLGNGTSNFTVQSLARPGGSDVKKDPRERDFGDPEFSRMDFADPLEILQRELDEIDETLNWANKPSHSSSSSNFWEKPKPRNNNCIVIEM